MVATTPKYSYKDDPYSSHSLILKLVRSLGRKKLKVLDVGCAQGFLAKRLSRMGHEVVGIETDRAACRLAEKYCFRVHNADLDKEIPDLGAPSFDLIVFGDVLEHLRQPEEVLRHFLEFLRPQGKVIISLPNIANIYIRLKLLFGHFDYADVGILDRTHLHFYTLKTLKQFLDETDLGIFRLEAAPIPLPLVAPATTRGKPLYFMHVISNFFAGHWKGLWAYQFIVLAQKNKNG